MEPEVKLANLAARQHGLLTLDQCRRDGLTDRQVDGRCRSGRWLIVRPGVYAIAGSPKTWEQAVMAVCLRGGSGTYASHLTAGVVWDLAVPRPGAIHVCSQRQRRIRLDGVVPHQSLILPPQDVTMRRYLPVTSAARTLVEISGALGSARTGLLMDACLRRRLTRLADIRSCVARLAGGGRRRLRVVRDTLAVRLPGYDPGDSNLEARALRALREANLPAPVQQHRVKLNGHRRYIDLAYPEVRLAIELDGWTWHGNRSAIERDRARRNELEAELWHVLQFTESMLNDDLVTMVARALTNLCHAPTSAVAI